MITSADGNTQESHENDFFKIDQIDLCEEKNEHTVNITDVRDKHENHMDTNKTNVRFKMNENMNVKDAKVRNENDIDYNKKGLYNYASTNNTGVEPMIVVVNINGRDINFGIDTGTYAAVISKRVYNEYFPDFHILKTNKDLRAYCGHP